MRSGIYEHMGEMMKAKAKSALGAGLVAVVLLVALQGCGGGSSSISKAEFIKEGKAICQKGLQRREEKATQLVTEFQEKEERATPKVQEEAALQLVKVYQETTTKLAEIGKPAGEEEKFEAFIKAREEGAAAAEASPGTILHSNAPFDKADKLAEGYGFGRCGI